MVIWLPRALHVVCSLVIWLNVCKCKVLNIYSRVYILVALIKHLRHVSWVVPLHRTILPWDNTADWLRFAQKIALLQKRLPFGNHTTFIVLDTYVVKWCIRRHRQHITAWTSIADIFYHPGNQWVCLGLATVIFTSETAILVKLCSLFFSNGLVHRNVRADLAELDVELDILSIYSLLLIADSFRKLARIVVAEFTHWSAHWHIQRLFIVQRWKGTLTPALICNILPRDRRLSLDCLDPLEDALIFASYLSFPFALERAHLTNYVFSDLFICNCVLSVHWGLCVHYFHRSGPLLMEGHQIIATASVFSIHRNCLC